MKTKQKSGFTLIEVTAVIAILGMIITLAVPKIKNTLDSSKKKTLVLTAKSIARSAEEWYLENGTLETIGEMSCDGMMDYFKDYFSSCSVFFFSPEPSIEALKPATAFVKSSLESASIAALSSSLPPSTILLRKCVPYFSNKASGSSDIMSCLKFSVK